MSAMAEHATTTRPVAIVTGASRGIGAATAQKLAADGYAVVVNYRAGASAAEEVVSRCPAGAALTVQADVTRPEDVARLFEEATRWADGRFPSALVNNAGVYGPRKLLDDLTLEEMRLVLDTNVVGPMLCSQAFVRGASTRNGGKGGAVVNVSSGSAYIGSATGIPYTVSKGAMTSLGVGLTAAVTAEGIRVNTVAPGFTRTDMVADLPFEKIEASIPMGRAGEPEEVADVISFLLSDKASFMSGAVLRVAGGRP